MSELNRDDPIASTIGDGDFQSGVINQPPEIDLASAGIDVCMTENMPDPGPGIQGVCSILLTG